MPDVGGGDYDGGAAPGGDYADEYDYGSLFQTFTDTLEIDEATSPADIMKGTIMSNAYYKNTERKSKCLPDDKSCVPFETVEQGSMPTAKADVLRKYGALLHDFQLESQFILQPGDADTPTKLKNMLEFYESHAWIDKSTSQVAVYIPVYNHNLAQFVLVEVAFDFNPGGGVEGGVTAYAARFSPYSGGANGELFRKFLEYLLFLLVPIYVMLSEVWSVVVAFKEAKAAPDAGKWGGRFRRLRSAVGDYFSDVYNWLDLVTVVTLLWSFALWMGIVGESWAKKKVQLTDNMNVYTRSGKQKFLTQALLVKNAADAYTNYASVVGVSLLMMFFRIFKMVKFHPEFAVIASMLGHAGMDLFYFFVVFIFITLGFVHYGFLLFGTKIAAYANWWLAFDSVYMAMTIGEFGLDDLDAEYGHTQGFYIWFYLFTILMSLILINVFIAIVSEGFLKAKEEAAEKTLTPADLFLATLTPLGVANAVKCIENAFPACKEEGAEAIIRAPKDIKAALSKMMLPHGCWVVMNSGTLATSRLGYKTEEEEEEEDDGRATAEDVKKVEEKVDALAAKLEELLAKK